MSQVDITIGCLHWHPQSVIPLDVFDWECTRINEPNITTFVTHNTDTVYTKKFVNIGMIVLINFSDLQFVSNVSDKVDQVGAPPP